MQLHYWLSDTDSVLSGYDRCNLSRILNPTHILCSRHNNRWLGVCSLYSGVIRQRFPSNIAQQEITIKQNGLITFLQVACLINCAAPPLLSPSNSGGFKTQQRYNSEHLSPRSPQYELRLDSGLKTHRQRQAGWHCADGPEWIRNASRCHWTMRESGVRRTEPQR